MIVAWVELHIRLEGCFSLKDKRHVLRGLLERSRRDFGVSVAEVGDYDLWNSAVVGASCVSNEVAHAESVIQRLVQEFDSHPEIELESIERRIERV